MPPANGGSLAASARRRPSSIHVGIRLSSAPAAMHSWAAALDLGSSTLPLASADQDCLLPTRANRTIGTCHASLRPGCQPFAGTQVSRVLRCRERDPGNDHTLSTDELSFHQRGLPAMSLVRVHNFAVSLDGFSTGAAQRLEVP